MSSSLGEEAPTLAAEDQPTENPWRRNDREFLLVMIIFVATVSFQAGINPPGGVWQDDGNPRYTGNQGKSIMASKHPSQFVSFIVGVTVAMVLSVVQVLVLMNDLLPYKKISVSRNFLYGTLGFAFSGLGVAYWSAVTSLTPSSQLGEIRITLLINLIVAAVGLVIILCIQKLRCRC